MNISELEKSQTWKGSHLSIPFEIVHWGVKRGKFDSLNEGKGCWNYYVYILESKVSNFGEFWLEPEVKEFSTGGTKYVSYDYYKSPLSSVDWHGGVTFWEGGNFLLPGRRSIKIGCDYSHLFDQERGYDYELTDVLSDALQTIEQLHPLLTFK